ncbi:MAG: heavy metal-associated domain-containing protein [Candidatus Woesearchaeota archaeon]
MKITLNVKGMHCKSCEMIIKDSLLEIEGVNGVVVSLAKNTVTIDYDERKVKEEMIKKIIEREGYKITE